MKLTLSQIADSLNLPKNTVERWIRQGRIPVLKNGDMCTVSQSIIQRWATDHNLSFCLTRKSAAQECKPCHENLLPAMQRGQVFHDVDGDSVETALQSAASLIPGISTEQREVLYDRLMERERLNSTGVGNGIALPHPRTPLSESIEEPLITTCFLAQPIDFNAIDGKAVFVMFVLLSPATRIHLHLLSRLAFCLRDNTFVSFLKEAPEREAFWARIRQFEEFLEREEHAQV